MIRRSSSRLLCVGFLAVTSQQTLSAHNMSSFDTKGLPETTPVGSNDLILSGAGMRKKKILFVDVDIYVAGLCLSPSLVDKTRIALNSGIGNMSSLVDVLFDDDAKAKGKDAKIAVILKFVRGVTTSQIVEAFNDSFSDCDQTSVKAFKAALNLAVGTNGLKVGEDVVFVWHTGGGLSIQVNGEMKSSVREAQIEKRLLAVYVDPSRTVSPELVKSVLENFTKITNN